MNEHTSQIEHALNIINSIIDQYPDSDQDVDVDESLEEFLDMLCDARIELQNALDFIDG